MKDALRYGLLYIHLIGFALLFGGFVAQYLTGKFRINSAMLAGALTQLVTGIALSAPLRDVQPPAAKLATKAVLALLIAIMVWVPRKKEAVARGHFLAIGGMTLATAAVAVFWRTW